MKAILFGASGMVGQGGLRSCLLDAGAESVLSVGRRTTFPKNPKLREIVRSPFTYLAPVEVRLRDYDPRLFGPDLSPPRVTKGSFGVVPSKVNLRNSGS